MVASADGLRWVAERVGCHLTPEARGLVAVDASGRVRGGVVYDCWTPNTAQCHMATETPMAWRCLLPHVFRYPFDEAGRGLLLGSIRGRNAESLAMAKALGFTEHARIPDGYEAGDDLVLVLMKRDECRWVRQKEAA